MNESERALMNGADIIVDFLTRQKVPYLFGLCGHGNVGFLDAAFKAQDRIRTISVHHEQTAGHMADAYFKVRHEPVATFTSCGPGSANLVMALAAAMMDSSAFFAITGNVPTSQFNRSPFQETGRYYQGDFPSVIRPYVKRSYQPTRVDMMPLAVRQGWELMLSGRPGPVNLDVPLNVFVEEAEVTPPQASARIVNGAPGNPEALTAALKVLLAAERPVIIAGQGVLLAEAAPALQEFAELTSIPVVTSPNGKGSINERHRAGVRLDRAQRHLCGERGDEERRRHPGAGLHLRRSRDQRLARRLHAGDPAVAADPDRHRPGRTGPQLSGGVSHPGLRPSQPGVS